MGCSHVVGEQLQGLPPLPGPPCLGDRTSCLHEPRLENPSAGDRAKLEQHTIEAVTSTFLSSRSVDPENLFAHG